MPDNNIPKPISKISKLKNIIIGIVFGILIVLTSIVALSLASEYFKQEKDSSANVQEITDDEAIELVKDCQIESIFHSTPAIINLKDGTERKYHLTMSFYNAIDKFEPKCGEVGDILF